MITEWFFGMLGDVIEAGLDLIPESMNPPGWLIGAGEAMAGLFSNIHSLGVWIPTTLAFGAAAFIMNAYIGGGVIKAVRILISHFTGGGGSAA